MAKKSAARFTDEDLLSKVAAGDTRAVARLLTLSENQVPRARKIQAELFKRAGRAQVVGVTGSPGAGKSTLVDQLAVGLRGAGKRVAIIAVDPTSPFSGGAVLGDRIRMSKTSENADIFIRSMATRGSLGGLSRATLEAVQILDAAGFDMIVIETVGVGQAEVDIVRVADTCMVVLVPGMGDSVQAFKAGILEIADIFVINKSDRDGADLLQRDLRLLMSLEERAEGAWEVPIVRTVATSGDGCPELLKKCTEHIEWLRTSAEGKIRKHRIIRESLIKLASDSLLERVTGRQDTLLDQLVEQCYERTLDPYSAVQKLLAE